MAAKPLTLWGVLFHLGPVTAWGTPRPEKYYMSSNLYDTEAEANQAVVNHNGQGVDKPSGRTAIAVPIELEKDES